MAPKHNSFNMDANIAYMDANMIVPLIWGWYTRDIYCLINRNYPKIHQKFPPDAISLLKIIVNKCNPTSVDKNITFKSKQFFLWILVTRHGTILYE